MLRSSRSLAHARSFIFLAGWGLVVGVEIVAGKARGYGVRGRRGFFLLCVCVRVCLSVLDYAEGEPGEWRSGSSCSGR